MKKVLQLLEKEINSARFAIDHSPTKDNELKSEGVVLGLERAVELVKAVLATEVWEGSIMHNKDKFNEYVANMDKPSITKEYALIGMSKVIDGYAATCTEFGDEDNGDKSFKALVVINDADALFRYVSECWNEYQRIATISCRGFNENDMPINPVMVDFGEKLK